MICIMRDELQIHHFDKVVSYFNEYFNRREVWKCRSIFFPLRFVEKQILNGAFKRPLLHLIIVCLQRLVRERVKREPLIDHDIISDQSCLNKVIFDNLPWFGMQQSECSMPVPPLFSKFYSLESKTAAAATRMQN